ncbi:MAG: hypothetical protein H6573_16155 [Lewinellaceae bacterium]|nr:hypothetical protein [Phaeodactylibacter sp.]MCB0614620.1 hypothetical protein [Phaeodactylibacter sp.]MCB9349020.1 hypothetical protein [Lewinellaceae bacterium]
MTAYDVLPDSTRVWIYQANQPFKEEDIPVIRREAQAFAQSWISHNRQLRAHADVLHNRFIVLMVDESQADASGCSIDKSVYFLKQLQAEYGVDLFDRMAFSFKDGEEVFTVPREEFARLYQEGRINDHTLVFDTLVSTKEELDQKWLKPLSQSWHKRMV